MKRLNLQTGVNTLFILLISILGVAGGVFLIENASSGNQLREIGPRFILLGRWIQYKVRLIKVVLC